MKKVQEKGRIIAAGDANVWPHEMEIAKVLAKYGHTVDFIRKSERLREHTADAYVDGEKWEFKSPRAGHTGTIMKNLKEARWQSDKVLIDSRRIKGVPDAAILREVKTRAGEIGEIKKVKYISKTGKIIDIK